MGAESVMLTLLFGCEMDETTRVHNRVRQIIGNIPQLSASSIKVLELIGKQAPIPEIAKEITADKDVAAKVLKLANFHFIDSERKVTSIDHASVLLGVQQLQNIVLNATLLKVFPFRGGNRYFSREQYWNHAALVAECASTLARLAKQNFGGEEFTCGILHDMGRFIMGNDMPAEFSRVTKLHEKDSVPLLEAEQKVFNTTHTEVGAFLAREWKLPLSVQKVALWHHAPENAETFVPIASLVSFADCYANAAGIGVRKDLNMDNLFLGKEWAAICAAFPLVRTIDRTFLLSQLEKAKQRAQKFVQTVE